jgi:hypothetical protein
MRLVLLFNLPEGIDPGPLNLTANRRSLLRTSAAISSVMAATLLPRPSEHGCMFMVMLSFCDILYRSPSLSCSFPQR